MYEVTLSTTVGDDNLYYTGGQQCTVYVNGKGGDDVIGIAAGNVLVDGGDGDDSIHVHGIAYIPKYCELIFGLFRLFVLISFLYFYIYKKLSKKYCISDMLGWFIINSF